MKVIVHDLIGDEVKAVLLLCLRQHFNKQVRRELRSKQRPLFDTAAKDMMGDAGGGDTRWTWHEYLLGVGPSIGITFFVGRKLKVFALARKKKALTPITLRIRRAKRLDKSSEMLIFSINFRFE